MLRLSKGQAMSDKATVKQSLKQHCVRTANGYYLLTEGVDVPVRIFMSEALFAECEEGVFKQAAVATRFPGVIDVVITPVMSFQSAV